MIHEADIDKEARASGRAVLRTVKLRVNGISQAKFILVKNATIFDLEMIKNYQQKKNRNCSIFAETQLGF